MFALKKSSEMRGWALLTLCFLITSINSSFAVNDPVNKNENVLSYAEMVNSQDITMTEIDLQLADIERILDDSALTYGELVAKYPEKTLSASLSKMDVINSIQASSAPLGIGGFFWGFCLSWLGILIVFLVMDDTAARKKEVTNAFIGFLISLLLFGGYFFLF